MEAKRWTLGVVLAAAVSLWGLVEADASPFSSYVLSDDLGNMVRGTAAEASDWSDDSGATGDGSGEGGAASGGADSGSGSGGGGDTDSGSAESGKDNNGHGNNEDGVDSSNKGQGQGGPNGGVDESCSGDGECVDDEVKGGSSGGSTADTGSTEPEDTGSSEPEAETVKTNNGKAKGKSK